MVQPVSDARQTEPRTMSVREFLRGGYKEPGGPIIVLNGSEVALVAFPGTSALTVSPPRIEAPSLQRQVSMVIPGRTFTPAPKPSAAKRAR